jgi:streptogramin lyase
MMRRPVSWLTAALVAASTLTAAGAVAADYPVFEDIGGMPLEAVTAPGSGVGPGPDGEPWLYLVSSGSPAVLSVVDARDGSRVHEFPLPGSSGSWAVDVTPNGDVYVGTYGQGRVYRYRPGAAAVEDLGVAVPGETFVWSVTHDEDGVVYGGTGQSRANVFRYDPATGTTTDLGSLAPTADPLIVRGIAAAGGKVYAGTHATTSVVEIDATTGERRDLGLPPGADPAAGVYDLDVRGRLLFARFSLSGSPAPLHVYDLDAGAWVQEIPDAHGLSVSPVAADGRTVYFVRDETLHTYDLVDRTYAATSLTGVSDVRGFDFLDLGDPDWPGDTLVGLNHTGGYFVHSPQTGASEFRTADAVAAVGLVRQIAEGPDGLLYAGTFLAGGLASYDPETGAKASVADEVGQSEGMVTHDGALYIGTYPWGEILRYDPDQPSEPGVNPKPVLRLYEDHGQSRPFALASAGDHLAIGTVAKNGSPGGGLTLLNTRTGESWFDDVVPGHSVVALTYRDGVLYGATSVYGGVGGPRPTETDAVVFAYDIEERRKLWEVAPIPGEGAIGELAFDENGKLWSHTTVSVFRIDVETREVEARRNYEPYPWDTIAYAHVGSRLWYDPYVDKLYVVSQAKMFTIDPVTLDRARVFQPTSYGFLHNNGTVFLARDLQYWEYTPSARPAAAADVAADAVPAGRSQTVTFTGLGPGEELEVWLRPEARQLGTVRADATGTASLTFTVPLDRAGELTLEGRRLSTRGALWTSFQAAAPQCDVTVDGPHAGPLRVTAGTTCLDGATVAGPVQVGPGAMLTGDGATVSGPILADGAGGVVLSGTTVSGAVTLRNGTGAVAITDSVVAGAVTLTGNTGGVRFAGNRVSGALSCTGNEPAPVQDEPNTVTGPASGQCAPGTAGG